MKKRSKSQSDDFVGEDDVEDDEVLVLEEEEDDYVHANEDDDEAPEEEVYDDGDDEYGDAEDIPVPKNAKKTFSSSVKRKSRKNLASVADDDELFPLGDYGGMALLPDHERRPLWVTEDGHLFLEMFHAARVYDFVITIAEPIFRPMLIHE